MAVAILICPCGMKLRTPGASPGRVGKCPKCGSMLKVPELEVAAQAQAKPARPDEPLAQPVERATFVGTRSKKRRDNQVSVRVARSGLVKVPNVPETRLVDSLTYPLWSDSGLAILCFMPPLLYITGMPMFAILPAVFNGKGYSVAFVILFLPFVMLLGFVGGHVLQFLGQILVTSSLGEVNPPRSQGWDLVEILRCLARWFWALVIGGAIGGMPAMLYWISCGEVDWLDRIVLLDLVLPGMAYAQMALLACLIFDSPLAANPVTVLRAIYRAGWGYIRACLFSGGCFLLLGALLIGVLNIPNGLTQAVAYLGFFMVSLYVAMVMLRRLGLFCFRHAVILEWFPDRSRRSLDEEILRP